MVCMDGHPCPPLSFLVIYNRHLFVTSLALPHWAGPPNQPAGIPGSDATIPFNRAKAKQELTETCKYISSP